MDIVDAIAIRDICEEAKVEAASRGVTLWILADGSFSEDAPKQIGSNVIAQVYPGGRTILWAGRKR